MYIKKYLIAILFLFIFLRVEATGQSCDVIHIKGEEWALMAKPINDNLILYARLRDFLPKIHCVTTANWDGYTAFWEIRNGYLYLLRMEVCVYDEAKKEESTLIFDTDMLETLFTPYSEQGEICARWFSGELRAGQGSLVRYVHIGFDRNMETEQVMTIKYGKVLQSNIYHNHKKAGLNLQDAQHEIIKRFPWEQFPEYQGQRLSFSISNFQMTNDGRLLNLDVSAIFIRPMREEIEDGNHPLVEAFKETLKSIYPWEMLYINGKFTMEYAHFVMPIQEEKTANKLQENKTLKYSIIGKVYGEEVRQFPPFDVVTFPLIASNLSIKELPKQGWLTDSTGCFQIDGLKAGHYHLKAQYVGLIPCDTIVAFPGQTDTLRLVLPLDDSYMVEYLPETSRENIRKGHPYVRIVIPEKKEQEVFDNPFWKKYGIEYYGYTEIRGKIVQNIYRPNHILTAYNQEVFDYLDKEYGRSWRSEAPKGIFGLDKSLNETRNYAWLIETLHKSKYPIKLQDINHEGILCVAYEVNNNGYITNPQIVYCNNRKFKRTTLDAFKKVSNVPTALKAGKDTLLFQYRLNTPTTPVQPHTDVLIIGYGTCDIPVLMRYGALLIAHTTGKHLEIGGSVCYLNELGDTIIPYGKYKFCQSDTIKNIGFVYEDKPNAKIVCIDVNGSKLFDVFKYDNGPDYVEEGLFRIIDNRDLIGFADTLGNVIIKPQFKFAFPFERGKAKVTLTGERKEVPGSNDEKYYWDSEEWYFINKKGQKIK